VRLPAQQSAEIFRQTRPVTGFAVSGGIVRNTALPMATIERAAGSKIETRGIQAAGTAPRAVSAGTKHLAVVAPAREVKAVAAARPQAVSSSPEPSRGEKQAKAPVVQEPARAKGPKAHAAPPTEPQRQVAKAPADHHQGQPPPRPSEASRSAEHASKPTPHSGKEKPAEKDKKPVGDKP
jgi:hypothetical protein